MSFYISISFLTIFIVAFSESAYDDLISTVVLYRHGDRAPIRPYKYDQYDESYWPLGLGQLTNTGKKNQHALGQWLRARYADFLPSIYNRKDITVQSSNVDRCLMSAELNLAGLYPPQGNQIWNQDLKWQPIPIHTVPEIEDAILAQDRPCLKYTLLYEDVLRKEPFNKTLAEQAKLMDYFSEQSGDEIKTLEQLQDLYNTVYIENLNGLYLLDWTKLLLSEEIANVCGEAWTSYAFTSELARLKSGPLIDLILGHFEAARDHPKDNPKLVMLSGHDSTIAPVLTAMGVFDYKWPDFASAVIFELREGDDNKFVNIFYKNYGELVNLTLPSCQFDCDFDTVRKILEPIRINVQDRDKECLQF